jgi:hypothetical protein
MRRSHFAEEDIPHECQERHLSLPEVIFQLTFGLD